MLTLFFSFEKHLIISFATSPHRQFTVIISERCVIGLLRLHSLTHFLRNTIKNLPKHLDTARPPALNQHRPLWNFIKSYNIRTGLTCLFLSVILSADERICSPPFMVLNSECGPDTLEQIKQHGLTFPFICKTRVAHGTNSHEMAIIFSAEDLKDVKPPCVIQSFINHNAVLYKVFVVGESYTVVERPSLKNFPSGPSDRKAIFFNSHNRDNVEGVSQPPNDDVIRELCKSLRESLGVSLFGIDVIINNQTGQHAVIDINAFPGYEGVPEFFSDLLNHIISVLQDHSSSDTSAPPPPGQLPALGAGERNCAPSQECCGMLGKESDSSPWIVEGDGGLKGPRQRLGCNTAMSPNFQQHCVSTIATKASSQ
ncbi:Inositol-tetrakisphosphate 1-kinase [Labeo rohita]|uniref:inositol-1,3,4-trisphosphate 5/6-kinase n=1 Tax=Labeo rohita TaxID=84645 RepID=A0ABQ8LVD9_LABRO|nr:Inositol-tetrakisphosphate 1-kinase [Labeo rohita]